MVDIASGNLMRRVIIQRPTSTNTDGQVVQTWAEVATVWAGIVPESSREYYRVAMVNAAMSHLVEIRYDAALELDAECRLVLEDGRVLNFAGPPIDVGLEGVIYRIPCAEAA